MKNIKLENYDELETLAEMAYLSHYVLHNYKPEIVHPKHEEIYLRIAEIYKAETLKLHPEKAKELSDITDYLNSRCIKYEIQLEREHFAEVVAQGLQSYQALEFGECRKRLLALFRSDD